MNKYAKLLRSNNFLIINKDFIQLLNDLNTSVYLSYLIDKYVYFSTNNMITIIDGFEYFFNIQKDIENEIYLSAKQQRNCLDVLVKLGIINTKLKGIPAKTFFNINFEILFDLISKNENTTTNILDIQDVPKGNIYNSQKVTYITNNKYTNNKYTNNKEVGEEQTPTPKNFINDKSRIEYFKSQGKIRYLDFVYLKPYEYETLLLEFGNVFEVELDNLNTYLADAKNFKKYTDHNKTLRKWINSNLSNTNKNTNSYNIIEKSTYTPLTDDEIEASWGVEMSEAKRRAIFE